MPQCFHHPDRETGRACTRCGRPACGDCLVQASVGSHCWECVQAAAPSQKERATRWLRSQTLVATPAIIAVTVAAYVYLGVRGGGLMGGGAAARDWALFGPAVAHGEWWRLFTHALVHYGLIHLGFNMLILYQVGRWLEPAAGPARFTLLYLVSVLGGAAGALILDPLAFTGGASGGVFGVAAAATLAMHRRGVPFAQTGFGPLLAVNLVLGFTIANVSVGGHLGGLLGGLLAAEVMIQARQRGLAAWAIPAVVVLGGVLAAVALTAASNPR